MLQANEVSKGAAFHFEDVMPGKYRGEMTRCYGSGYDSSLHTAFGVTSLVLGNYRFALASEQSWRIWVNL